MAVAVKYTTNEEKRMIQAIQKANGAVEDGVIGTQTLSEIAKKLSPEVFPLTLEIYQMPVIIARDIIPFVPNTGVGAFSNCISGSFTYPRAKTPCSILISNGKDVCSAGSKAWAGFKEVVIVRYKNGVTRVHKVLTTNDIPDRSNVRWAVGGMGLLYEFNPDEQGYKRFVHEGKQYDHSDVLRKTHHTVLGIKDDYCYLAFCKNMTGVQVNDFCRNRLKLDMAVMLDGGTDIPAINGAERFAKINTYRTQGYAIQGVK